MPQPQAEPTARRRKSRVAIVVGLVASMIIIAAAVPMALHIHSGKSPDPAQSIPYLGLYDRSLPLSYAGVSAFTANTGVKPNVLMDYSDWPAPFQVGFARAAVERGALPLIQINPFGVSLAAIAAGQYDSYLTSYADAVRAYGHQVILSFGHEMNGGWYPWSYQKTPAKVFVAAWRHVVDTFRARGASNVTWLWTVNMVNTSGGIPSPVRWWPGSRYVNWVGIDGYYWQPSWTFASMFGQTIAEVRAVTNDPIIIAETAAASGPTQPAKIADLFAGIRLYNLLGFIWFDAVSRENWRIMSPGAFRAFRQGAKAYEAARS